MWKLETGNTERRKKKEVTEREMVSLNVKRNAC